MKNTKQKGILRFIVYPENGRYVGVCLDLDIIEEDKDPKRLSQSIKEAAYGYVETVKKENLSNDLLNQPAPKKYWDKWYDFQKIIKKPVYSPIPKSLSDILTFTYPINGRGFIF